MSGIRYETLDFCAAETKEFDLVFGLDQTVASWRKPLVGELSIEETTQAAGLGLEVCPHHTNATLVHLTDTEAEDYSHLQPHTPDRLFFKIRVNEALNELEKARAVGHELGHIVLFNAGFTFPASKATPEEWYFQERFAEYFARKIIVSGGGTLPYRPTPGMAPGQISLFNPSRYANDWAAHAERTELEYGAATGMSRGEL